MKGAIFGVPTVDQSRWHRTRLCRWRLGLQQLRLARFDRQSASVIGAGSST